VARKSQQTITKRQREQKKAEKAAQKRVRRSERTNPSAPPSTTTEDHAPVGEEGVAASE
jgi:hypothetical protein